MARRKKIEGPGEEEITSNISALIDCVFLLLMYFIACTSIVSEKKLDISIPGRGEPTSGGAPPPLDPGNIQVRGDGSVYWNQDMQVGEAYDPTAEPGTAAYREQRRMETLVESLKMLKSQADTAGVAPIVMLTGAAAAPHQRIVDVMAALAEADIHSVGLSTEAN